ncbi:granzyme B(G,H) [Mugil cephalus]|uniref:granzyme B(G,H) n=1 Tax=Mugil cephalus TaxID=48193 RepID=UPI001FB6C318|nr:granzyme B(G,H) [Mugil cephalus]
MLIHSKLVTFMLVLSLNRQVYAGTIVGGHEAQPHSRPYMVLIERQVQGKIKFCDGFLLNEDFVMSAAHCLANAYTVLLGLHEMHNTPGVQRIPVSQVFPHKGYNSTVYKNDVMLLKLTFKANFSKNVRPIDLAGQDDGSLPKSCIVSGWGKTSRSDIYISSKLMEVNVTLINDSNCGLENSYCSEGEVGPAEGDSGGPLVCEGGKAYGVVSSIFTPHSGGPLIYRYAKIPDKKDWITSTMKNALR